ncbi:MAG: GntR family transcriptional regulator [Stappiaceae bacterium]
MSTANTNDTAVYEALRNGLIWGRWKSGEHLKPQHLRDEMNCTVSMLREALLRLAGEGLVVSEKNHGFRAVAHSKETFREAAHLRLVLECEAAEMALAAGDFDWEMAVSAAHNKLTYVEKQMLELNDVSEHLERWSRQDWEFHSTLLSACGSTLLMRSYKSAFDTFRMYAVSEIRNFGFSAEITLDEHAAIYEAAVQRDKANCIAAIERHLTLFENRNRSAEPVPEKKKIVVKK